MIEICRKKGCNDPVDRNHKYCKREHSPYGNLIDTPESKKSVFTKDLDHSILDADDQAFKERKNKKRQF